MQHFLSDLRSLFLYHIIAAPFLFCKANWWWWKQKQHIQRYNVISATIHLCEMSDFKTLGIHFLYFVSCFHGQNKQIFNSLDAFVKTCITKYLFRGIVTLGGCVVEHLYSLQNIIFWPVGNSFETWSWALHNLIDYWSYILGLCWTKTINLVCLTFS